MKPVSHPLIAEIASAPAKSRPQAPARDEEKFIVPEVRPVESPRNTPKDQAADNAVAAPVQETAPADTSVTAQTTQSTTATEKFDAPAATAGVGQSANAIAAASGADVPAPGANANAIPNASSVVTPPVQTPATQLATENAGAATVRPGAETKPAGGDPGRATAAQLVGANAAQTANVEIRSSVQPVQPASAAAVVNTATAPNPSQNTVTPASVQVATAQAATTQPVNRAVTAGGSNAPSESSETGDKRSRAAVSGGSSTLPATMASDTANTVTKPATITATAATPTANTQAQPQNNSQILAQALASAAPEATPNATPSQILPTVSGETMSVTQSFNAEMRAAIDAPTQAAAYTARGAVTAQPATEQIAMQISRAADQGIDRLSVQLKPAELGKVTIDLEIGPDNRMLAVISAERSETLDLLQRDARSLEKALANAGLETDSGSLEFNLQGEGESADNDGDQDKKLIDGAVMLPGDTLDPNNNGTLTNAPVILPDGRLDIQV